jgi:GNAT superfamily N-acetyltransferase
MIVREAGAADIDAIVAMLADDDLGRGRERPGDPAYREAFAALTAQPGNAILVAERDGRVIGCLQVTLIHGLSRRGASRVLIEGVRVAAEARGAGVGAALVEAAVAQAREAGALLVQLTSDRRRERARRFYERLGFVASHVGMKREL